MSTHAAPSPADRSPISVIGAGVIGLSIALRLARGGHDVTIIDRQAPGRGCSFGNAGRIANECIEPLASPRTLRDAPRYLLAADGALSIRARYALRAAPWLLRFLLASLPHRHASGVAALGALQEHSLEAFGRLVEDAGCEALLKARGHLVVSERPDAGALLRAQQIDFERHGIVAKVMQRHDVQRIAPGLSQELACGLYFPDTAHVVDPYRLCRALARACERHGARIVKDEVQRIVPQADGSFLLHAAQRHHAAGRLVVAAGAWSRPLARQLGHRLPLDTERGYHLTLAGCNPDLRLPVTSLERHTVMTPMSDGLRITGFVEFGGLQLAPDPRRFAALRRHVDALLPGAELSAATEWMGYRPSLPDHLPVIGRCRRHANAVLAFGHQHLGLTLSAITADIVDALFAGRPPPVDVTPFRCDRYD